MRNGPVQWPVLHTSICVGRVTLAFALPLGERRFMTSPQTTADLRILATSDVHMHLTGWDALHDAETFGRGMDRLASTIVATRKTARGACLLVDNGDTLQGTPLGRVCAEQTGDAPHPWPALVAALDYDAIGLGNHDFDFGLPFLEQIIAQTPRPVLCASVLSGTVKGGQSSIILHRSLDCSDGEARQIAIGITSVLPPQTAIWNHRFLDGQITFRDGVEAARLAVEDLKQNGAEVVLVLCHSGLSTVGAEDTENFALALARDVGGIDALVLGHTHQLFPGLIVDGDAATDPHSGTLNGVPAVMPGYAAEALGVIDLSLAWQAGLWRVDRHSVALRRPDIDTPTDARVTAIAAPAIAATRTALGATLGQAQYGFHSYFDMLQSGCATALAAQTMTRAIADEVRGTPLADLPLVSAIAPMAAGGRAGPTNYIEIAEGAVQERHVAMMAPYPNTIWAAVMRGADLWHWAERAAAFFAPCTGRLPHLVDPATPAFNFDRLYGLHTVLDPFQPSRFGPTGRLIDPQAQRVRALTYQGQPVEDAQPFLVAMTSYRGAGGGAFPGLDRAETLLRTEIDLAYALRTEILSGHMPAAPPASVWTFAPGLNRTVVVETAPKAAQHLHEIAQFDPHPIGMSDAGFLQLRVTL